MYDTECDFLNTLSSQISVQVNEEHLKAEIKVSIFPQIFFIDITFLLIL